MKMFVANCTQQVYRFLYRVIENQRRLEQIIPIGGQIEIAAKNITDKDVDFIVSQHAPYGMVRVDEIDRTKPFVGLCYSIDRPIQAEKMRRALRHNEEVLIERGQEIRKASAVALNNSVETATGSTLTDLELQIEEANPDKHVGDTSPVDDTIRVTREANPDGTTKEGHRTRAKTRTSSRK